MSVLNLVTSAGDESDTAHENQSGSSYSDTLDYMWVNQGSTEYVAGMVFEGASAIQGMNIDSAILSIRTYSTSYDDPDVDIYIEGADTAATYSASDTPKDRWTSGTKYGPVSHQEDGIGTSYFAFPELDTEVQQLVDNHTPTEIAVMVAGAAVSNTNFIIRDQIYGSGAYEPLLDITYSVAGPTITDVESDEDFHDGDTAVTITGIAFEASQGTGKVELSDNAVYATGTKIAQTVTSWSDTSIDFTAVLSTLAPGPLWLWVTNDSAEVSVGDVVTVHRAIAFTLSDSAYIEAGIDFVGYATGGGETPSSYSIDLTSLSAGTLQEDDLVIVACTSAWSSDVDMAVVSPTGYTEVADLFANDNFDTQLGVSYKIMGATPDTTVSCWTNANGGAGIAYVFRNVDTDTPIDVTTTTATATGDATPDPPSITPTTSGAVTVAVRAASDSAALTSASTSTGYGDLARSTFDAGVTSANITVGWKAWTSGAEDPDALTTGWQQTAPFLYSWNAATLALRPSSTPSNPTTAQLTAPASGSFTAGQIQDDKNPSYDITFATNEYTEVEWAIEATTDAVDAEEYEFRVVLDDGIPLDTYTVTPKWTIGAGVSAVGSTIQAVWDTLAAVGDESDLQWSVAAAISDEVQAVWHTTAAIGDTSQAVWHTIATVGDTTQHIWNARATIGYEAQALWNTFVSVGDESQTIWNTHVSIFDTLQAVWDTLSIAAVNDDIQVVWDTRAAVGETAQVIWHAAAPISDSLQAVWDTLFTVGDDTQALWRLRVLAGDDSQVVWDTAGLAGDTSQLKYRVLEAAASNALDWVWHTSALINIEVQPLWGTLTFVGDTTQHIWNVGFLVGDELQALWDALTLASDTVQTPWNVLATIGAADQYLWNTQFAIGDLMQIIYGVDGPIFKEMQALWNALTTVNDESQALWNTLTSTGDTSEVLWNVLTTLGDQAQAVWHVRENVSDDSQVVWHVGANVSDTVQALWDVLATGGATDSLNLSWGVREITTDEIQALWDDLVLVGDETQSIWNLGLVTGDGMQALWDTFGLTSDDVQVVWDTLITVNDESQAIWNVLVTVNDDSQLVWHVIGPVGQVVQALWNTLVNTGETAQVLWDTLIAASHEAQVSWGIHTPASAFVQLLWDIGYEFQEHLTMQAGSVAVIAPTGSSGNDLDVTSSGSRLDEESMLEATATSSEIEGS